MNMQNEIERLKKTIEELEQEIEKLEKEVKSSLPDNDLIYVSEKNQTIDGQLTLQGYRVLMRIRGKAPKQLGPYASIAKYESAELARETMIGTYQAIVDFMESM